MKVKIAIKEKKIYMNKKIIFTWLQCQYSKLIIFIVNQTQKKYIQTFFQNEKVIYNDIPIISLEKVTCVNKYKIKKAKTKNKSKGKNKKY